LQELQDFFPYFSPIHAKKTLSTFYETEFGQAASGIILLKKQLKF
jgi:hypothetical protein